MKPNIFAAALSVAALTAPMAVQAKDSTPAPVELNESALAAIQVRNYDVAYDVLFPATMATLQTLGYQNVIASKDAGTASAETEAKGKVIYNIIWGFGKKKRTQRAAIFMEPKGAGKSVLRLRLTIVESKSRGIVGAGFSEGQAVKVAEPYEAFYTALGAEVATRGGAVVPAESAPTSAPAAAPAQ